MGNMSLAVSCVIQLDSKPLQRSRKNVLVGGNYFKLKLEVKTCKTYLEEW